MNDKVPGCPLCGHRVVKNEPVLRSLHVSIDDAQKLRAILPMRNFSLFGIKISPNRTLKNGECVALYSDGDLLFDKRDSYK